MSKRILVPGGGIAGCTLAYFLRRHGYVPVVVDVAPSFERRGYLLALNEQIGQRVADKMKLLDKLRQFEVPLTRNVMCDTAGTPLLRSEADHRTLNERVGLMLNRADLHFTLYEAVKDEVEFRMGREVASLRETGGGVDVTFSDGTHDTFDLVIGADGVHSKTRELVFGQGFEHYMGYAYFAFITANAEVRDRIAENTVMLIRGDGFMIAYHRLAGDEIGGYVFHKEETLEQVAPDRRRDHMLRAYGAFDRNFAAILEGIGAREHIFHDGFTKVVMPAWHKRRTCLIGDAAFCPTPASGVGASMAMAAGYILATKLSRSDDYAAAFADYDAYMRPYVRKAQSSAARMVLLAAGGSIISYKFTNFLLRLIPGGLTSRLHSHAISMPLP